MSTDKGFEKVDCRNSANLRQFPELSQGIHGTNLFFIRHNRISIALFNSHFAGVVDVIEY